MNWNRKLALGAALLSLWTGLFADGISRAADGRMQTEDLKFGLIVTMDDGTRVEQQSDGVLTFPDEMPQSTKEGIVRFGKLRLADDAVFHLRETLQQISKNEIRFEQILESPETAPTRRFGVGCWLSFERYQKRPVQVDGKPYPFNGRMSEKWIKGKLFEFPLRKGIAGLLFPDGAEILIKPFGKSVLCQVIFSFGKKRNVKARWHLRYKPYAISSVDLRPAVNMGFADPVAEDGAGGWTDQGPENDLSMMKTGKQVLAGIPFEVIDPAKNNGKSCLLMRGGARPSFCRSASVSVPGYTGRTLFLLNAIAWPPAPGTPVGKVVVVYEDGGRMEYLLKRGRDTENFWAPRNLPNAQVGWKGRNRLAEVGLYVSRIPLEERAVRRIEFHSQNQVWMIVAASIGTLVPPEESAKIVIREGKEWRALPYTPAVEKGSIADFSRLLDAPAGKYGFLTVKNGHFEFEKRPGVPVRFWGCNLCSSAQYDSRAATLQLLDHIARSGFNVIRLHHFDDLLVERNNLPQDRIRPDRMDQLDFLFAEAKKRGIYVTLDLFTLRKWAKIPKYGQLSGNQYKVLCYFDPDVRQDLIRFARTLLDHRNPYTSLRWAEDPALIFLNLVNEGTLPVLVPRADAVGKKAVEQAFRIYLREMHLEETPENRKRHFDAFLFRTGEEFFSELKTVLRSLGVRVPLSDQNYETPLPGTRNLYDYVDVHFYWAHPRPLSRGAEELPNFTSNLSAVAAAAGGIRDVFRHALDGKPMVISEWNYCYPNSYIFEGPLLAGAYAALQDYDGLIQFYYTGKAGQEAKPELGPFLIGTNPMMRLASRCGALLFLRNDVSAAPLSALTTEKAAGLIGTRLPLMTRIRQRTENSSADLPLILAPSETPDRKTWIRHGKEDSFFADLTRAGVVPPGKAQGEKTVSTTGELVLDPEQGTFHVAAERSEALVLPEKKSFSGKRMRVRNGSAPAAFFLASADDRPLPESRRLLLMHLTDVKCDGQTFADRERTIQEKAGDPGKMLLRRNRAELFLKLPREFRIFACDSSGKRLFELPVDGRERDGTVRLILDNGADDRSILLYELEVGK